MLKPRYWEDPIASRMIAQWRRLEAVTCTLTLFLRDGVYPDSKSLYGPCDERQRGFVLSTGRLTWVLLAG